jgi:DNA-binding CsgD family transcriptional regulator
MNLEFNIGLDRNKTRRVVFQYSLLRGNNIGSAPVAYGKIVDISHLTNDGPPRLSILQNNQVVHSAEATREEMLRSSGINLNKKDLSVLTLQSKGLRVRDIAQKLNTSELSIYTVIRDMKRKTKMQTLPLMQLLRKKGLID